MFAQVPILFFFTPLLWEPLCNNAHRQTDRFDVQNSYCGGNEWLWWLFQRGWMFTQLEKEMRAQRNALNQTKECMNYWTNLKKRSFEQKSIYKLLFTCNSAPAYAAAEGLHFKGVWIRDLLHFDCRRLWRGLFNTLAARHSSFGNQRMSKRHERRRHKVQLIDDLSFKTIFQNLSHSVTLKK